jgi:phage gpG-like protein
MLNSLVAKTKNEQIEIEPVGTRNKRLAAYHTEGNSKLPIRPFLDLSYEDVKQLTAKMQDSFSKILVKYFK